VTILREDCWASPDTLFKLRLSARHNWQTNPEYRGPAAAIPGHAPAEGMRRTLGV